MQILEKFENGGFTLKTQQMFSVHTTLEELKSAVIIGHLDLWGSSKSSIQRVYSTHRKTVLKSDIKRSVFVTDYCGR